MCAVNGGSLALPHWRRRAMWWSSWTCSPLPLASQSRSPTVRSCCHAGSEMKPRRTSRFGLARSWLHRAVVVAIHSRRLPWWTFLQGRVSYCLHRTAPRFRWRLRERRWSPRLCATRPPLHGLRPVFGSRVAVIPCGEKWPDGSLRPALEDWLGAGAVIGSLGGSKSPEAIAAERLFAAAGSEPTDLVRSCASAREIIDRGFASDVELAAELDCSDVAPVLTNGEFCAPLRA